ncbi:protein of unknown function DUF405 [Cellulomonas flavigena DSM 20109]|uniref:DUF418 domain-containing protein n=1 Tax=Cellulomonas flavigena (strain ATCC 482 / DSM 20109 / BCRC 11376 / JCM 18109 / NBRC 3775 / NCIMB 8073 / NRS 134) TaxID=446466 RepID=D5UCK0_CELFN|nr:DUF418 domain-containing protein [Cellulomonas flavigena]ADG74314.1 protein of unknown function DUF405 [Cellulomonas flavigena DSM 20109]
MTTSPAPAPLPQAAPVQLAAPHVDPVPASQRAVAPDVARGLALLGIALANSVVHLSGGEIGAGSRPVDGSTLDRVVDGLVSLFVDRRTMPMFALLYGYGIGVVVRRRAAAWVPWPVARGDLLRRAGVLVAFGAVHIALLFEGDILASYGLAGLLAVAFVRASDRRLLVVAACVLPVAALAMGGYGAMLALFGGTGDLEVPADDNALVAALFRLVSIAVAPLGAVVAVPLVLAGLWAARREVLERPADHLALLRRTALVGLAVSMLGGLPQATIVARLREASVLDAFGSAALHQLTGVAGGLAFAALVGWAVAARGTTLDNLSPAGRALRAVGQRSMTCYLLQSVLFVLPLAPWAGALGVGMSTAQVAAWAVGVWLVTVAVAVGLEATGRRGPAEALYRRLVYRPVTA